MTDKDALELLNMFTTAAQIAKKNNKYEFKLEMDENTLTDLLIKAFPNLKNNVNTRKIAREILSE